MKSKYKLTMCRLCLCENQCFFNIFDLHDWHGYIAAEVIYNLLQFQVSETDGYPHVLCSTCLTKLTDFMQFKECCQKSIVKFDNMFVCRKSLEENKPEMDIGDGGSGLELFEQDPLGEASSDVSIKSEDVIIDSSSHELSEVPLKETEVSCGPILLKYEVLPFSRDSHRQVELPHGETVTNPKYPHYLENKRSNFTYKEAVESYSCNYSIVTNDELIFEKTKNISLSEEVKASSSGIMEGLEYQRILPRESMCKLPLFQQEKERVRMEQDIGEDGKPSRETGREKEASERREGLACFHCGIVLMSKLALVKHMKVHGFDNSYDSTESSIVSNFNGQFKRPLLKSTISKPKCAECSKTFSRTSYLKRHMRTHTGSKPYKCAVCNKNFSENGSLKRHIRTHTGAKPYKCAECSKCFNQTYDLKLHIRLHTGSKPYKCAACSKSFRNSSNLKVHMRTHRDSKPYKCAQCSNSFSQTSDLKTHMNLHTGSKLYICAECNKSFRDGSNFRRHMKIHTGSKQYKCADCNKCFSDSSNLKTHMRLHTGSKPYKCAECNKSFSQNVSLKKHMSKHTF